MSHIIRYYDKHSDELIGEISVKGVSVEELRNVFGLENDNPMYDCYMITPENIRGLTKFFTADVFLEKYEYFLEYD